MRISLIQYPIKKNGPEGWKEALPLIEKAQKTNMIVLPEMWLGGPQSSEEVSEWVEFYKKILKEMLILSKKVRQHFIFSQLEKFGKKNFNTLYCIQDGKILAKYRKIHLFSYGGETKIFSPGRRPVLFNFSGIQVGGVICYDIRFPELIRKMTFAGMKILFVCAQWPATRREHWLTLLRTRAIENQIFVVAVNRLGKKDKLKFCGDSVAFDPWGNQLTLAGSKDQIKTVALDLKFLEKIRREYPFLKERRIK